jgi:hypothetical protein
MARYKRRRIGRIFVAEGFVDLENIAYRRLMGEVAVLECAFQFHLLGYEMTIECPQLDALEPNLLLPWYTVEIHGNPVRIIFKRVP